MNKEKIAILLPFKDHFTNSQAGSASIWVKDFNMKSKYKKQLVILGNTPYLNDLIDKKNYKNLTFSNLNLRSKNISYVDQYIKYSLQNKFDIVEIHNRPSYVHQILKSEINSKIVLIFHNNPLSLGGSNTHKERQILLDRCEKLIFVRPAFIRSTERCVFNIFAFV